jgi:mitogen-activated protein kinase kinase
VWSTGISLIELALGRFPFAESSSDDSDLSDLEGTLSPSRPGNLQMNLSKASASSLSSAAAAEKAGRKSKVRFIGFIALVYDGWIHAD